VYRPKSDGRQRPLGIPALAEKIVQRATVEVLHALDAGELCGVSSGVRPGRNPHEALAAVTVGSAKRQVHWGLAADSRGVCDAMAHAWLVRCIAHRLGDQRVVRHRQKWLYAGVLEEGQWHAQEAG
jgi:retron-type reverse transcriptase